MSTSKAAENVKKALAWAVSPKGRHDISAVVAALTALYTALHRAGAL